MTAGASAVVAAADTGKAGPLGLLVVVLLGVAVFLLGRSMLRHLKKVPASFEPPEPGGPDGEGAAAAGGETTSDG